MAAKTSPNGKRRRRSGETGTPAPAIQKLETIGRLAGGVAHDFNNMLNVILGYVDLIKLKLKTRRTVLHDIQEIEKAACRSRDLTAQLLAFSRKQMIQPQIVNLNRLIGDMEKTIRRSSAKTSRSISFRTPASGR
jgi:signal transduction histidine kinase